MRTFLFPGQGSQRRGMGLGLFDELPEYAAAEKDVDRLLGYSLRKLCLDDADNRLKETQYTQPALYVVNALHYYKARGQGLRPAYLAGHSLGEYTALLAAGVFDFLTGLRLVKKRGELMAQAKKGGMGAVVGLHIDKIPQVIRESGLTSVDVANFNSPSQTVVSGPVEDIIRAGPIFERAGARMYMPLPVSAAFHSRYMADAARMFAEFIGPISMSIPKIPVVSNVTARPYPTTGSESIKSLLVDQITHSVLWTQTLQYLRAQNVTEFTEIGPGNVLTRLLQQVA